MKTDKDIQFEIINVKNKIELYNKAILSSKIALERENYRHDKAYEIGKLEALSWVLSK